ncbi:Insecticidal toxin complex protein tccz [Dickeya fangzhongdai]|uniref:Insecticidal toxin complex protein tccz n=1 Tax=Dickeya fangzhongdai TaxID=1778540 RepID=A0A2K8QL20_9GAMM|nr:Insecticidal toxin complex protein tccz [Dickeya fangzhongdai]ATZ94174.1 Insecticidal toxin complex protein tccz [Dickeya fangzhongdai]QOH47609.1 Insecticidal toxin complex protein tccz [Dickeya fangzhongdai]QOH51915.1 Insecticidal toxin complex protein tccz [Dickeya fangzhongdai]WOY00886.1 Insecticidal toxin complex protein tccz [Dickeya fangzhongdai]WOY03962.1 Insecticidal toxin complex protein tccz [Dickeya fangzhongdai]
MSSKIGLLCLSLLIPFASYAEKGEFKFSVGTQNHIFDSSCIKSIHYVRQDETGADSLGIYLMDRCGEQLEDITDKNMGKKLTISYLGNELSTVMIVQRLKRSFRISTKDTPRVVLMWVIDDYNVSLE